MQTPEVIVASNTEYGLRWFELVDRIALGFFCVVRNDDIEQQKA